MIQNQSSNILNNSFLDINDHTKILSKINENNDVILTIYEQISQYQVKIYQSTIPFSDKIQQIHTHFNTPQQFLSYVKNPQHIKIDLFKNNKLSILSKSSTPKQSYLQFYQTDIKFIQILRQKFDQQLMEQTIKQCNKKQYMDNDIIKEMMENLAFGIKQLLEKQQKYQYRCQEKIGLFLQQNYGKIMGNIQEKLQKFRVQICEYKNINQKMNESILKQRTNNFKSQVQVKITQYEAKGQKQLENEVKKIEFKIQQLKSEILQQISLNDKKISNIINETIIQKLKKFETDQKNQFYQNRGNDQQWQRLQKQMQQKMMKLSGKLEIMIEKSIKLSQFLLIFQKQQSKSSKSLIDCENFNENMINNNSEIMTTNDSQIQQQTQNQQQKSKIIQNYYHSIECPFFQAETL